MPHPLAKNLKQVYKNARVNPKKHKIDRRPRSQMFDIDPLAPMVGTEATYKPVRRLLPEPPKAESKLNYTQWFDMKLRYAQLQEVMKRLAKKAMGIAYNHKTVAFDMETTYDLKEDATTNYENPKTQNTQA